MEAQDIKKVIVVFKTHLDVGYTALAAEVLDDYCRRIIPAAVALAAQVNTREDKRFIWTVGSYLIHYYLRHAGAEECRALEEAIRLGDVRWHTLPFTAHVELMDAELLRYSLGLAQKLNGAFGTRSIAAKMTDVPGHTIAMVPLLAEAGVEFLHIGVNPGSMLPGVPALFRWQRAGCEVVVNYSAAYGQATWLENGVALEFAHAGDNQPAPTAEELEALYARLRETYPNAHVAAGSLDDFAEALREVRQNLPLVTEEIGDSWIHSAGTDPLLTSHFKRLLRLKNEWLAKGQMARESAEYDAFMEALMLVAEHTGGMDTKRYLLDFMNWRKADFTAARAKDVTSLASFGECNRHIMEKLRPELEQTHGPSPASSYSRFEASHAEQRGYISQALAALPENLRQAAQAALRVEHPAASFAPVGTTDLDVPLQIADWTVTVGKDGQLTHLTSLAAGIDREVCLGLFEYEITAGADVDANTLQYGRDMTQHWFWVEPDFGKPGLRYLPEVASRTWRMAPTGLFAEGNRLLIQMGAPPEATEEYGCPRRISILHRFEPDGIYTSLYWAEKDASRVPEAIWFTFNLGCGNPSRWRMQKLGDSLSPLDVVARGSRRLHCVERLLYTSADGSATITPVDSPLVSVGGKALYDDSGSFGRMEDGFSFVLYNNRWGTNFKLWFEDDMRFYYKTEFSAIETM